MSEEVLQIAVKRKEAKGKQERERFIQVNAEFQKIVLKVFKNFFEVYYKELGGSG